MRSVNRSGYSPLDKPTPGFSGGLVAFLAVIAAGFLAWAIITTVVMTRRVDPPGHFMCGSAVATDGDLCYDFIVLGCGSAGSALSRRLSDNPTQSVLCIEEGPDYAGWDPRVLEIPYGLFAYGNNPIVFPELYYEIPGKGEPGIGNTQHLYTSGRTLGGGGSENYMVMMRGDDEYWDNFDASVGSPGTFSASSIHTEFQNIEYFNDRGHFVSNPTRGRGQNPGQTVKIDTIPHGSIVGTDQEQMANLLGQAWGIPVHSDQSYNSPGITFGSFPYTEWLLNFNSSIPEQRWTSRSAFLGPNVMDQTTYTGIYPRQLKVLLNSSISNLIFTGSQFNGVHFGGDRKAYARKEVIVTAGIHTAAILQRSGIGSSSVLQGAGITPLLINENIGTKMGTDIEVAVLALWPNVSGTPVDVDNTLENFAFATTEDPFGIPGQRAFVNLLAPLAPGFVFLGMDKYNSKPIGQATVVSGDPNQQPLFVSNQLTDSDDLLSLRTAVRNLMWGIFNADPGFFPLNIDNATLADDDALNAWIRANAVLTNHYENQCPMGTNSSNSVLDNRFRVWNTRGLRVCDLQSYATKLAMHPSLSTMMMGNLCGRLILEDHGLLVPPLAKKTLKKRTVTRSPQRINKMVPFPRAKRDLWTDYLAKIEIIREKFPPQRAKQMIQSIMRTSDFMQLCEQNPLDCARI
jgi:choline dehydrogenase-like flavoprotein